MLFKMGKLRLSVHRKNEMRKKYGFYPVRIPLKAISVLTVSVPLNVLSFEVSLPLSAYLESPARSLPTLQSRISAAKILPQGIIYSTWLCIYLTMQGFYFSFTVHMTVWCSLIYTQITYHAGWIDATHLVGSEGYMVLCKVMSSPTSVWRDIYFSLRINADLSLKVLFRQSTYTTCPMIPQCWIWRLSSRHWIPLQFALMMPSFQIWQSHAGTFMDAWGKCYSL